MAPPISLASWNFQGFLRRCHLTSPGLCLCHQCAFLRHLPVRQGVAAHFVRSLHTSPEACWAARVLVFIHAICIPSFHYGQAPCWTLGTRQGTRHSCSLARLRSFLKCFLLYKRHSELSQAKQGVCWHLGHRAPRHHTSFLWVKHCLLRLLFMKFKPLGGME